MKKIFALLGLLAASPAFSADDPYLWLEEVQSPAALDWVRARNAQTLDLLEKQPQYKSFYKTALDLSNDKDRIPYASFRGGYFYNFWQDEKHVRGMWRRATQAEYLAKNPRWETLLDVDALAKKEKENWVYKGADCLPPDYDRCLVSLSRGGKDAVVTREFDVPSRSFVKGGFFIPESKSDGAWLDRDTLLVSDATDPVLNTDSGYPRIVRRLKRGGELAKSEIVFTGEKTDVSARGFAIFRPEGSYPLLTRAKSFFEAEIYLLKPDGSRSKLRFPDDASFSGFFRGYALAS
ncbi:MAG: S9 family peptidase, partial [Elusimicrobia bacterium]|nr:S9 family peptidase [Elusimicrobiota bacterium]